MKTIKDNNLYLSKPSTVGRLEVASIPALLTNSWIEECNSDSESHFSREFLKFETDWKEDKSASKALS